MALNHRRETSTGGAARHPFASDLGIGALDCRPGDTMRGLFLARLPGMGGKGMVERLAIDILRVLGKMAPHGWWEIGIVPVRHGTRSAAADQQHRPRRDPDEVLRNATQQQTAETAPSVRADHDEIRAPSLGFLLDGIGDPLVRAIEHKQLAVRFDASLARRGDGLRQNLFALLMKRLPQIRRRIGQRVHGDIDWPLLADVDDVKLGRFLRREGDCRLQRSFRGLAAVHRHQDALVHDSLSPRLARLASVNSGFRRGTGQWSERRPPRRALELRGPGPRRRTEQADRTERAEHGGVRAIVLPAGVARIVHQVRLALLGSLAGGAEALQIVEHGGFDAANLVRVDLESGHPSRQQKVLRTFSAPVPDRSEHVGLPERRSKTIARSGPSALMRINAR